LPYFPLARDAGRIHVCAHRGHSVGAPENTLPALDAAADHGADVAEIDVVLTRDEAIVLLHDEILDRTTDGQGRVAELDLAIVQRLDAGAWFGQRFAGTRVPTLGEALAAVRLRGMALLVEIKERQRPDIMIRQLARLLQTENALDDVLVISFDHVSLARLKEVLPSIRTELITHARHVDPVAMARRAGAASVSIEWDMFHGEDASALHEAGIAVRVTVPGAKILAARNTYGFDDDARLAAHLAAGHIDVLAGDDASFMRELVNSALGPHPRGGRTEDHF
jgi:glycerophosphoryl diester phosphodiesterase